MKQLWTLAAVLAVAGFASAAPLVDLSLDTTTVSGDVSSSRSTTSDGEIGFDLSTPFYSAGDYENAPDSPVFYGGLASSVDDNGNTKAILQLKNGSGGDYLQGGVGFGGASGTNMEFAAAFVWQKADFLSGFDSAQADLESLSVTVSKNSGLGGIETHWMVQIGSQFYVSQESFTDLGTFTTTSFASSNWAPIDLSSDMLADPGSYAEVAMSDVQAVGFYGRYDGPRNGSLLYGITDFSATAVPEPTSIALLGLGGLATVIRRRRSR